MSTRAINVVIPDAGPLISLAKGGHLDLLLLFSPEVRILIADVVDHEVTRFADKYPDALGTGSSYTRKQAEESLASARKIPEVTLSLTKITIEKVSDPTPPKPIN